MVATLYRFKLYFFCELKEGKHILYHSTDFFLSLDPLLANLWQSHFEHYPILLSEITSFLSTAYVNPMVTFYDTFYVDI